MSKRKRNDSLSINSKSNQINDRCENDERIDILDEKQSHDGDELKRKNSLDCSISSSNENINLVNSSSCLTENRRKSNRILSLKKSIFLAQQNEALLNSPTNEDLAPIGQSSSVCESNLPTNAASLPESLKSIQQSCNNSDVSTATTHVATNNQDKIQNKNISSSNGPNGTGKSLRKNQVWTEDDTRWFFRALCEHGKDFPRIQTYIAARCEKKGIPSDMIKNYEQVRHYYYRMWHKISQMLKISDAIDKGVQEIYGLINYGEVWKKFGSKLDAKPRYLQELVDFGYTVFRVKGKNVRVRTPICNALKKLHNISYKTISKPITPPLPKEIIVELLPATNNDWLRVHSLAQNPRLRTRLTMQHRLSTLIAYLEKRWSFYRIKDNATKALLNVSMNDESNTETIATKQFSLRLRSQNSVKLCEQVTLRSTSNSISVNNFRATTHANAQIDLSLSSYMKNFFNDNNSTLNEGKKSKMRKSSAKKSIIGVDVLDKINDEKMKNDEKNNKTDDVTKEKAPSGSGDRPLDLLKMLDSMNEELEVAKNKNDHQTNCTTKSVDSDEENETKGKSSQSSGELEKSHNISGHDNESRDGNANISKLSEPPAHTTLAQWLAGGPTTSTIVSVDKEEDPINEDESDDKAYTQEATSSNSNSLTINNQRESPIESKNKKRRGSFDGNELVNLLTAEQARKGWSLDEAQTVTIGEIYLLFCRPSKITLEYSWTENFDEKMAESRKTFQNTQSDAPSTKASDIVTEAAPKELDKCDPPSIQSNSTMLERLLIAANITLSSLKKPANITHTSQSGAGSSSLPSVKASRKRPTKNLPCSQLLPNLIQETILNDASGSTLNADSTQVDLSGKPKPATPDKRSADGGETREKDQFVAPKLPPPRFGHSSQQSKSKYRTAAVLDDPTKVKEVLDELKANKYRRQRRPFAKPFMYGLQNKFLGAKKPANGARSALLVIPTSHLTSNEGQVSSKQAQILLTDLLASHIPQASISLSSAVNRAGVSQSHDHNSLNQSSVVIPIHVETKTAPKGMETSSSNVASSPIESSINLQSTSVNCSEIVTKQTAVHETVPVVTRSDFSAECSLEKWKENNQLSTLTSSVENKIVEEPFTNSRNCESSGVTLPTTTTTTTTITNITSTTNATTGNMTKPSTADVLTHSQLSWLNDVNDFSLGSLIAACDIVNNDELGNNQKMTTNPLAIHSDIETHMNSMASDNSVDLMAKFADLAAKIVSDTKSD